MSMETRKYKCLRCGKEVSISADSVSFESYDKGSYRIQDLFPNISAGDREIMISGLCGQCFDDLFLNDEDEVDEGTEACLDDSFISNFAPDEDIFNKANWKGNDWIGRK